MKRYTFFMRFYGQSPEVIQEVVDFVLKKHPGNFLGVFDADKTCSLGGLPFLSTGKAKEARIEYESEKEYRAVHKDEECREFYSHRASTHDGQFHEINSGDISLGL